MSWYAERAAFDNSFKDINWSPEGVSSYIYSAGNEVIGENPLDNRPVGAPGAGVSIFAAHGWGNIDSNPTTSIRKYGTRIAVIGGK
jgi:hypothetical protein